MHSLYVLLWMLVLLVATTKILAVKVGISIDQACLPCQPAWIVLCLPATYTPVEVDFLWTNMPRAIYFS
jgi:hypothetical protein